MKKLLSTLLRHILRLALITFTASSFCADNTPPHESSTEETPKYTDELCFDLVLPAIKRLMQKNHDNFPAAFRHNNALWNSIIKEAQSNSIITTDPWMRPNMSLAYTKETPRHGDTEYKKKIYTFLFSPQTFNRYTDFCDYFTTKEPFRPSSEGWKQATTSNYGIIGLCNAIKHNIPTPFILNLINQFKGQLEEEAPHFHDTKPQYKNFSSLQFFYVNRTGARVAQWPTSVVVREHHGYHSTPFYISTLRFAHNQDPQSKSIMTALMKVRAPLDSMDPKLYNDHPGLSEHTNDNYLDLLTHKELRLLVKEECDYIKNAYLTLQTRSQKEESPLPTELLIKILNYIVGIKLDPAIYEKIINDKIQHTYNNAN